MSHFTKIERANIISAQAFIKACEELGFVGVKENCNIKDYYGKTQQVDVAISCGKYDIALKKNANGTYDLIADWWGVQQVGLPPKLKTCMTDEDVQNMILKHTTKHTLIAQYRKQGFRATVREDENENLQIDLLRN